MFDLIKRLFKFVFSKERYSWNLMTNRYKF